MTNGLALKIYQACTFLKLFGHVALYNGLAIHLFRDAV